MNDVQPNARALSLRHFGSFRCVVYAEVSEFGGPPAVIIEGGFVSSPWRSSAARRPLLFLLGDEFEFRKLLVERALDRAGDDVFHVGHRRETNKLS